MRYFFSLFLIFLISIGIYSLFIRTESHPIMTSTLSGVALYSYDDHYEIAASVSFDSPRTAFYFSFPRSDELLSSGVTILWGTGDTLIQKSLDTEDLDMRGYDTSLFSSPWITSAKDTISFRIISPFPIDPKDVSLLTSYSPVDTDMSPLDAYAATRIISRAEWGADESYRYADSAVQKGVFQEYLTYRQSPKTQDQIDAINTNIERRKELERLFPDTQQLTTIQRSENGHRLVWPIQKTQYVNRIVIHHTAESLDRQADDLTYLRDIYKYHAVTRGWGDIGYNYIIGQRGAIYEGRAGGDYVVGAHVLANNEGSVGISVIGNYETLHLNRDQKVGLESAISYVAEKYGINLSSTASAIRQCSGVSCKTVTTHTTRSLIGHRDLDATVCPGQNIYAEIPNWITNLSRNFTLKQNPESGKIDPLPEDEVMNMTLKVSIPIKQQSTPSNNIVVKKTQKSPNIKIKLSYSGSNATLEGATVMPAIARIGFRRIPFFQGNQAQIRLGEKNTVEIEIGGKTYSGSSFSLEGEVIRIASWVRIPSWDTTLRYNDNIFRGKIIVRNVNGVLIFINELPVEDYIKGLGEVSNTDLPEKIKTILVSARSYAYYYMDKSHRKYNTSLYDGSDDPDSFQKYLGYGYEMRSPKVVQYADETRSLVVKYQGELVKTWYFSSSDGRTLSYTEYCEKSGSKNCMNIPYLVSVEDPGGVGKVRLGHGVGISGIGATYFAQQGWDYKKIIQYYLKGVEIMKK